MESRASGGEGGLAWAERANQLAAFGLFQRGARRSADGRPLGRQVAAARAAAPEGAPWLVEGLGFAHAEAALRAGEARGLLSAERAGDLAADCLIALHAGVGLALARHVLAQAAPGAAGLDRAVRRFAGLCGDNARPGFAPAVFESLGLVARLLHPRVLAPLDRRLAGEPERLACLWHGAGRGLYFLPRRRHPPLAERLGDVVEREAPPGLARANLLAGLAWALTLVNLGRPPVMAALLRLQARRLAAEPGLAGAFAGGVSSAVAAWSDMARDDLRLPAFLGYRPGDREVADLWEVWIAAPCRAALAETYPDLVRRERLGDLFFFAGTRTPSAGQIR